MRHIIGILLQNESGALSRVAGLFSSRGYNIESLSVAATDDPALSRITLVTKGSEAVIHQIVSQLNKLIDVVAVDDMTSDDHFERELALIKLRVHAGKRDAVKALVDQAGARVLSDDNDRHIVELVSSETAIVRFAQSLEAHGELLEIVRSGVLGISRQDHVLHVVEP
jgi:acetolactate synthase I/III small subunit